MMMEPLSNLYQPAFTFIIIIYPTSNQLANLQSSGTLNMLQVHRLADKSIAVETSRP
jgi:hypothetical protein